jgi:hypothetical protein
LNLAFVAPEHLLSWEVLIVELIGCDDEQAFSLEKASYPLL